MAGAFADGVEGDLEDDAGLDFEAVAFFGNRQGKEFVGEFGDFGIGEAGVGFAEGGELVGGFVAEGEGVVAQDAAPFAMAVFHRGDDDIKGGEAFLSFTQLPPRRPGE